MKPTSSRDEEIFADALARPEPERAAFLARACGNNAAMLARIAALIAAHEGPESLLAFAPETRPAVTPEEKPGDRIGHYKLLQQIGDGGCGVVWMAEQEEPVRRRVALKVIKLGMDTKAVVARFEAERQALAMMDHPNIAKVHDAGSTETGRPFFVMELVRGIPITKYCDENKLNPTARLELFIKVCHAVQHAHQKGIIHRDLKPSNILVTVNDGAPTPKVIDFGIAKATQGKLTDATLFTALEQFIGTPVYMSPEQAEMSSLDIDTRSDIYSLGVLLYELLTGRPPFDPKAFAEAGVDQVRKQIREVEPPRPSARLSTLDDDERTTIARLRGTAASQLSLELRGDLDWIVMRCIEKDRTRRYDTANGLAMDIQRYLRNEPVVARPPSTAYLLQKLVRRHKVGFAAAAIVATTLVLGAIISTWQAVRADAARDRALAAEEAQRIGRERAEAAEVAARMSAAKARESEQLAAEGRRNAETLLSFVFTDLGEQLSAFGQLQILDQLTQKAVAYYEALPPALQTRETRASHALAIAGVGRVGGWMVSETSGGTHMGEVGARVQLERAVKIVEGLEATGPLTPFMRLSVGSVCYAMAHQYYREGRAGRGALLDRADQVLTPALSDREWGHWSRQLLATLLAFSAHGPMLGTDRDAALKWLPVFERALVYAEEADAEVSGGRRGLRPAELKAMYAELLFVAGEREKARRINAEVRALLSEFMRREPFLASARSSLAMTRRTMARQAHAAWAFPAWRSALDEIDFHYTDLLKQHPTHWVYATMLGRSLAFGEQSRFNLEWMLGNFSAAQAAAKRAAMVWDVAWVPVGSQFLPRLGHMTLARVCAAIGNDLEADAHMQRADAILKRDLDARTWLTASARQSSWVAHQNLLCEVEFERLNWTGIRRNAEELLRARPEDPNANRHLMRAAFETGDYATARWCLEASWPRPVERAPGGQNTPAGYRRLDRQLTRIHVLARAGEIAAARIALKEWWPEVEAVHAAGPDYLFNQVQTARALSIRAEIDGAIEEKRAWLERAAGWLRPAATTGRLTRYEREVLLAGIEKQLAALPP